MRILLIGATGTIGKAIAAALTDQHEVLAASRSHSPYSVDITNPASLQALFAQVGKVDAVISAAGEAAFGPLDELTDADFAFSLSYKLMGQVNVARFGFAALTDGGSVTLTSGIMALHPIPGSSAFSLVNAGLEGFTRAAALEAPRQIRVNVVSPGWATETLLALKMDPAFGTPASDIAKLYLRVLEGHMTGETVTA